MSEGCQRDRPIIEVNRLRKEYSVGDETVAALRGISVNVPRGEIGCIFGTSGSGKSSLLNQLAGMEKPTSGEVRIGGVPISRLSEDQLATFRQKHLGFVFQSYNLLPNLTATENVAMPLMFRGVPKEKREEAARKMLRRVGLANRLEHFPGQMSGGQQQRVGIARALAARPTVLLSDEATSALDPETTSSILDLYRRINAELGLTVLLITHEMDVVKDVCDSAALIEHGRVVESGRLVDIIRTPGSRLTAQLFPIGPIPVSVPADAAVIDITFAGGTADRPIIAQLARDHGVDVSILGALIEQIAGTQAGRTRLELPSGAAPAIIADLQAQGLLVEVLRGRS